jgi:selenocysteine lyase/cysteine desulfurase
MDFPELRASTPATSNMTYLNAGWAGPSPDAVVERMREAAARESAGGPAGPEGHAYVREIEASTLAEAATMLGVSPDDVLLTHGTTEGVNIAMGGLAWEPGDTLLTSGLEHPGIKTPSTLLGDRRGVNIHTLDLSPTASADECVTAFRAALTSNVKLVALSHVMYTCGLRIPAKEIVDAAHEAGALMLLDGAQAVGHIALDLTAMGVDFYATSGQKWLGGPGGTGAFYVRPDRRDALIPQFRAPGLDFTEGFALYSFASQGAVDRAGYGEAVRLHNTLGSVNVESHNTALATQLREEMAKIDGVSFTGPTSGSTATAITTFAVDDWSGGWDAAAFSEALWERHRLVARNVLHPDGVRLCTAAFNDASDVEAAVVAIKALVGTR